MGLPEPPLLVITDRKTARRPLGDVAEAAFAGGLRWLMVREKDLPEDDLAALVEDIVARAMPYGARVSVNRDAAVAAGCGAGGVHLPQGHSVAEARRLAGDGALLIGVSAHSLVESERAAADGADYVTLSPVFAPASKPDYGPALGVEALGRVADGLAIPVVALGGIDAANAGGCIEAGAAGVAVLGGVMGAADPRQAVAALLAAIKCARTARSPAASRP